MSARAENAWVPIDGIPTEPISDGGARLAAEQAYRKGWSDSEQRSRGLPLPMERPRWRDPGWDVWYARGVRDQESGLVPQFDRLWPAVPWQEPTVIVDGTPAPREPGPPSPPAAPPLAPPPTASVGVTVSSGVPWWLALSLTGAAFGAGYVVASRKAKRRRD